MAKRSSGQFERHENDLYDTPYEATVPLLPFLRRQRVRTYAEPCFGNGYLIRNLRRLGFHCGFQCDIREGEHGDAFRYSSFGDVDAIITNPPWTRSILHPMIDHFMSIAPTWLLFEADWAHTLQAQAFWPHITHIVAVGRVRWIEGSEDDGKDNASWYRFKRSHRAGPRMFNQRQGKRAKKETRIIRLRFTEADDRDLYELRLKGQGAKAIARTLGRPVPSIKSRLRIIGDPLAALELAA